jgi:GR25 family glycosyltransferase involved in LPS biosynthesis/cephalosporin hydroxylase
MENFTKQFLNSPSEDNAYQLIRHIRCASTHHLTILIGDFLINLYPESLLIRSEVAVAAFYAQKYKLSYDLYTINTKAPNLNETDKNFLKQNMHYSINHIANDFIFYNKEIVDKIMSRKKKPLPLVTFTITSCKRFDLFEKTINSFLNCCTDLDRIDNWFCVDDNSSEEDREKMKEQYPFFEFYWKTPKEKGHPRSMNIIRDNVKTEFIFHMEDDWKFFAHRNYIGQCIDVIISNKTILQCLVNKNYAEISTDINIIGGLPAITKNGTPYYIHEHTPDEKSKKEFTEKYGVVKSCAYWNHFSFRPSLIRRKVFDTLGPYNEDICHFEMDYSKRYVNAGYKSAFLDGIFSLHIGRLTSERYNKLVLNAYDLNNETQFGVKTQKPKRFDLKNGRTFVINIDKRKDRLESFDKIAPINYEIFSAVNGENLKPNQQLQRIFENNNYNMRSGMVGCAMSHIKLCIDLLESNVNMFCILEDDSKFGPSFEEHLNHLIDIAPKNWDLIYLGHHVYPPFKTNDTYKKDIIPTLDIMTVSESLQRSMGGTFGYLITKEGARKFLEFINLNGMTNGIDTVQQKSAKDLKIYYSYPHIVFSDCALPGINVDSDIQYNYSSLSMENYKDDGNYKDCLKKDGKYNIDDALQTIKSKEFKYTNNWFDRNINLSMKLIKQLTNNGPVTILEVGTYEGKSAIWMLENLCSHPDAKFVSIDSYSQDDLTVKPDTYVNFCHNIKLIKEPSKFSQIVGNSQDIMPTLIEKNEKYDIIYIDTTCDMEKVLIDITNAYKLLTEHGIILINNVGFDDSKNTEVAGAIRIFLMKNPKACKIILKEFQWMLQKA